jgi:hypothetical protein
VRGADHPYISISRSPSCAPGRLITWQSFKFHTALWQYIRKEPTGCWDLIWKQRSSATCSEAALGLIPDLRSLRQKYGPCRMAAAENNFGVFTI